ncbi:MAG: hypothetical protein FWB88_06920 [Defluviitaleaceae bacterium]|nr:hypothetical protein [Defluviitaleaceae bacterium]MCL2239390.1 hypothetical protein [Defluviitaleaceae bacterium]
MENEKKVWLIEQYAQKAWTVSLALSQEAARAGAHGKGYAVVAHEARILADKLYEYVEKARFGNNDEAMFKGIRDFAMMFKYLSVNAAIQILHMVDVNMEFNIPKSMSVFTEELRRLAIKLSELADENLRKKPLVIPEFASPSEAAGTDSFFLYSICGHPLIENPKKILEIHMVYRKTITDGTATINLRGEAVPIFNCHQILGLPQAQADMQTVMFVTPEGNAKGTEKVYGVPIDDLDVNAIFYSRLGRGVTPKENHAFANHARECWDVVGGDQVVFVDWQSLVC